MRTHRGAGLFLWFLAASGLLGACGGDEEPAIRGVGADLKPPASTPAPTEPDPTFPVTLTDDEGVEVTLEEAPQRIITFAPANTETVFALGAGDDLVCVSGPFDNYPPAARTIEECGGQASIEPNIEKVVSLDPDVLIATSGGEEWKERLRDLGVAVFTVDATTLPDVLEDITTLGTLLGRDEEAADLVARLEAKRKEIEREVADRLRVTCFYEVYYGPPLSTVGPGSFVYDLLRRAGCDPVTNTARTQYPTWSVEQLVADDPDVYLVDSLAARSAHLVARRPGFRAIGAVARGQVVVVESDLVTRPGPRVVEGLEALNDALLSNAI